MSKEPFLRNAWYVVATTGELKEQPIGRRICNEPMVIFRRSDGSAAVLSDRCPHRKAMLSIGHVVGDSIECGYHGYQFGGDGVCTLIPSGEIPPASFHARAFPVVETYGFIWAWTGDPALADPAQIPDLSRNDSPEWAGVRDYLYVKGNYQLLIDNLLDLTHTFYVHRTTLSGPGTMENPLAVTVEGDVVRGERIMRNVDPAPIFRAALGVEGKIDRWQIVEYHPPILAVAILAGKPPGTVEKLDVPTHIVYSLLTPETERSTHYFWSTVRCWGLDDPKVSKTYYDMTVVAFNEDVGIVEGQQRMIDDDPRGAALAYFSHDKAALEARRLLTRKMRAETERKKQAATV